MCTPQCLEHHRLVDSKTFLLLLLVLAIIVIVAVPYRYPLHVHLPRRTEPSLSQELFPLLVRDAPCHELRVFLRSRRPDTFSAYVLQGIRTATADDS